MGVSEEDWNHLHDVLIPKEENWHIHDAVDGGESLAITAFKEGTSENDRVRAIETAKSFQKLINEVVEMTRDLQGQIVLDRSLIQANQGFDVVFDILDINEVKSHSLAVQTRLKNILVFCPFDNLTERLAERNRKALSGETDLNEIRAGTFPFLQYAKLIRPKLPTDSQSDVIDRVSKKAAIKAFEKNFDDGVEVLMRTPNGLARLKQMDQEESLALRRIREQEIFLTAFGFTEADPLEKTLEYVSREKYDQLINTSDASLGSSPIERGNAAALRILAL